MLCTECATRLEVINGRVICPYCGAEDADADFDVNDWIEDETA